MKNHSNANYDEIVEEYNKRMIEYNKKSDKVLDVKLCEVEFCWII